MKIERISLAPTEASVTSPVRVAPAPQRTLKNTDNPLAPTVKAAQMERAMKTVASAPMARPNFVRTSSQPVIPPSGFKKFLMGAGVLLASVGVVAGFISIIALGPIGLAVAGGAAALAAGMIWLGNKVK